MTAQGDRGLLILEIDIAVEHVDRKSSPDSVPEERLAIGGPVLCLGFHASFASSIPGFSQGCALSSVPSRARGECVRVVHF